jgi:hypothetical protein
VKKWILDEGDSLYVNSLILNRGRNLGGKSDPWWWFIGLASARL